MSWYQHPRSTSKTDSLKQGERAHNTSATAQHLRPAHLPVAPVSLPLFQTNFHARTTRTTTSCCLPEKLCCYAKHIFSSERVRNNRRLRTGCTLSARAHLLPTACNRIGRKTSARKSAVLRFRRPSRLRHDSARGGRVSRNSTYANFTKKTNPNNPHRDHCAQHFQTWGGCTRRAEEV